jgi:hypothetical protein
LYGGVTYAVCTENGARQVAVEPLLAGSSGD